jgi:hypothetical protein
MADKPSVNLHGTSAEPSSEHLNRENRGLWYSKIDQKKEHEQELNTHADKAQDTNMLTH